VAVQGPGIVVVMVAAFVLSGCLGGAAAPVSSGDAVLSTVRSDPNVEQSTVVRVPQTRSSWIGAVIPRVVRAGLRTAVRDPWHISSFDGSYASVVSPRPGTVVRPKSAPFSDHRGRPTAPPRSVGRQVDFETGDGVDG
jgi:hypothetical protein